MPESPLLVVIVCYRAVDLVIDCLHSIAPQVCDLPGLQVEICENGSGSDATEELKAAIEQNEWSSWVTLTSVFPNRGFAGGNNVVLRKVLEHKHRFRNVLLLNSDTIVRPGVLRQLVNAAETYPRAGVIAPRLDWPDGTPQESTFLDFTPIHEFINAASTGQITRLFRRGHGTLPVSEDPHYAEWASFACALIRREVLEQCGLLDEDYYLYFDDADYCRRARDLDWQILYFPDARVVHLRGRSNPVKSLTASKMRRPRYWYLSRNRYYAKFYGRNRLWLANLLWLGGRVISLCRELTSSKERSVCQDEWRDIWMNAFSPLRPPSSSDHQE